MIERKNIMAFKMLLILFLNIAYALKSLGEYREIEVDLPKPVFMKQEPLMLDSQTYYYVNYDNEVIIKRGNKKVVINKNMPKEGDYAFLSATTFNNLYILTFWYRNPPHKDVYVAAVDPKTLKVISFKELKSPDPVGKIRFFRVKDKLFIAWLDEKEPYKTYVSYTTDGENWKKPIELGFSTDTGVIYSYKGKIYGATLGCEPKKLKKVDNKTKVEEWICGVFRAEFKKDKFGKLAISFEDPLSWKGRGTPYNLQVVVSGDKVYYAYNVGGSPRVAIGENNENFREVKIPTKWFTFYNLSDITLFAEGEKILIIGEARPTPDRLFIKKKDVAYNARWQPYALYSEDAGKTWRETNLFGKYLDHEFFFTANPYRVKRYGSKIIVYWTDYRYIIPIPFIRISEDFGKTWKEESPLIEPYKVKGLYPHVEKFKDGYYIWFTVERKKKNSTEMDYNIGIVSLKDLSYVPLRDKYDEKYKEETLKKTIDAFYKALIEGNSKKIYSFFDPVFKEIYPYPVWENSRVKGIKFLEKKLISVSRIGNVAVAYSTAKVELPKNVFGRFEVKGKRITNQKMYDVFVFIGGKWYLAVPKIGGGYFIEW